MVQRVQVLLIDDLDESDATETVRFGLDGTQYEIDLNDKNAGKLRADLTKWVEKGRKASPSGKRVITNGGGKSHRRDVSAVRVWARKNGHEISERGRIPEAVQTAYDKANA